jgi:hypothetical protein
MTVLLQELSWVDEFDPLPDGSKGCTELIWA